MIRQLLARWRTREHRIPLAVEVNQQLWDAIKIMELKTGLGKAEIVKRALALYGWAYDKTVLDYTIGALHPEDCFVPWEWEL